MAQGIEHLPGKPKALSSNVSTMKQNAISNQKEIIVCNYKIEKYFKQKFSEPSGEDEVKQTLGHCFRL
jgi:hypothetical protein